MVREISRKLTLGRFVSRRAARIASAALIAGATLWASPACGQADRTGQPNSPARYMPPVHVQPTAYSVLDGRQQAPAANPANDPASPMTEQQIEAARSLEIARMSEYMRQQNASVTAAQDAQVNAAIYRKQVRQIQQTFAQPARNVQQADGKPQQQNARMQQQPVARVPRLPQPRTRQQPARPAQAQAQQIRQTAYTQEAVPYGLQERISKAFKGRFSRPKNVAEATIEPTAAPQRIAARPDTQDRRANTQLANNALEPIDAPVAEPIMIKPRLNAPGTTPESRPQSWPTQAEAHSQSMSRMPQMAENRDRVRSTNQPPRNARSESPRQRSLEEVIVPSFVEAKDFTPQPQPQRSVPQSVQLASARDDVVGSGVRKPNASSRPRVSSRPRPIGYGAPAPTRARQDVSIFQQASSPQQPSATPRQDDQFSPEDEISRLDRELGGEQSPATDIELPLRRPMPDGPALLDLQDDSNRDRARDARSRADSDMDALEDEDIDLSDDFDDEDDEPPVLDERDCDEFRALLLDKSIRDISLDISPPSSAQLQEMDSLNRSWTDTSGNIIATGTMIDLRRGYVILDSGQKLPYAKLAEADWAAIANYWQLPSTCSIGQRGSLQRNWVPQSVTWHASSLCHKPLYFENRQLERYGHSRGPFMQPVQSTLHFFGSVFFLPYNTAINPPNECQYSLGFYRPGNCAPWLVDPIPFSRAGIRRQALVATGLAFIP